MKLEPVATDKGPKAIGPYSQAIVAGDTVYVSGQLPFDPATGEFVTGDIATQTTRVLDNLAAILSAAGSGLDRIVKTTVFLVDMNDFQAMNGAYEKRFGGHRPARSTVAVAALPRGGRLEIECIAKK